MYTTGGVRLTGTGAAADYDDRGTVDQADLDLVLLNWGSELLDAPAAGWSNDLPIGPVDQEELDKVLLGWGSGIAAGTAISVPEPTTVATAMILLLLARAPGTLGACVRQVKQ